MPKKSVSHEMGARVKEVIGAKREGRYEERREGRHEGRHEERREGRHEERREGRGDRRRYSDGFQDAESSDWLFGAFFFVALIFALSPGVLLTIPPARGGLFMSGSTSTVAAFLHAILIVVIINLF